MKSRKARSQPEYLSWLRRLMEGGEVNLSLRPRGSLAIHASEKTLKSGLADWSTALLFPNGFGRLEASWLSPKSSDWLAAAGSR